MYIYIHIHLYMYNITIIFLYFLKFLGLLRCSSLHPRQIRLMSPASLGQSKRSICPTTTSRPAQRRGLGGACGHTRCSHFLKYIYQKKSETQQWQFMPVLIKLMVRFYKERLTARHVRLRKGTIEKRSTFGEPHHSSR